MHNLLKGIMFTFNDKSNAYDMSNNNDMHVAHEYFSIFEGNG